MDFVKNQIQRIQQQLSGLTASQKMLTGALVAIMVMTLLYWGRFAGTADMAPLLEQSFSQSDLGQIQGRLQAKGVPYTNSGDRILVPAERRMEVLADLAYARMLPQNTQTGFDQMVSKLSPWASASERTALENRGKEITCAQLIGRFPDVEHADVVIDPTRTRHIGNNIEPSASITITMRNGSSSTRQVAEAASAVVAGAQAGLSPARINVIVNGVPQRPRQQGGFAGDDQFELTIKHKQAFEEDIRKLFAYVPGLLVSVHVRVNNDQVETREKERDAANTLSKETETELHETETSNGAAASEPGVVPNLGANEPLSVNEPGGAGGGEGQTSRETMERSKFELLTPMEKETVTRKAPGSATVVSASVRVPRSFLVDAFRTRNAGKTPDDKQIEAYASAELKQMEQDVRNSAGMDETANVSVSTFDDVAIALVPASMAPAATMSVPVMIGSHGKEIALGALALVSLFMLMMMVKRSAPAPAIVAVAATPAGVQPQFMSGEAVSGEAGEGTSLLDGMELDEDAVRTQQMLDQVSTMVKENPDGAAALVKRWLNRD